MESNLSASPLSSSNASPHSEERYNIVHDQIKESKEKMLAKQKKQIQVVNQYMDIYQIFTKLLLGRDIKNKDQNTLTKEWGRFIDKIEENVLPDAVISFPNPDSPLCDNFDPMNALEAIFYIEKVIKVDRKQIQNQIFVKAIEGVYSKLSPYFKSGRKRFGLTYNSNQKSMQKDALIEEKNQIDDQDQLSSPFEQKQFLQQKSFKSFDVLQLLMNKIQNQLIGDDQLKNDPSKTMEAFDLDYKQFKEMKPKIMIGGNYMIQKNSQWRRTSNDTQDFLTLLRQCVLIQIIMNGFNVITTISENGKYFISRLYINEENLKTFAEKQKLKKKLNFCFTNLFSLEPVDSCFRPLRLNNRLWKPQEYDDVSEMFLYLRPKILNLLDSINFKRISRETNQSRMNVQLFQYGKLDLQDDYDQPTDDQWFAYYQYLVHMDKYVSEIRKEALIDSDAALIINKQLKPYELYIIRNQKYESVKKLNKFNIKEEHNRYHQLQIKKIENLVFNQMADYQHFLTENKQPNTKILKIFKKEKLAQNYFLIFQEALSVANSSRQHLQTIWDLLNVNQLDTYVTYTKESKTISPLLQYQQLMCWYKYQINEYKKISLFSNQERLKITEQAINNFFQINDLIDKKIISQICCLNDHYELFGHVNDQDNQFVFESNFYKQQLHHLEYEWKFNATKPWYTPIDEICQYYGEKIGLYFYFSTYYTKMLLKIAFIALGCNLVQWVISDKESDLTYLIKIIFPFIQVQWTNIFVILWQKNQYLFNLKFGQSNKDVVEIQRSNFTGKQRRSIENDQLNSVITDEQEFLFRTVIVNIAFLLILIFYAGILIAIYLITISLKDAIQNNVQLKDVTFEVMVTATINIIIIQFLGNVYEYISIKLTDFQNQKTVKDYEESFIAKMYILYFVSYVGPLLIIQFLNNPLHLYCEQSNCEEHVEYHFGTFIIWIFFVKTIKILKILYYSKKIPIFQYSYDENSINQFAQEQLQRKSYAISSERYGTLEDYMEIFLQITLLSIFGYSFPFSFFLFWIQNIAQMQADRAKFIYYLQRPWPQNNSSLGIWNSILEFINYVSILTNTGQMTMTYYKKFGYEILLAYMCFLIFNFSINFIMTNAIGQIPFEVEQLIGRSKYMLKSTIEQFQASQNSTSMKKSLSFERFPLFKMYNTDNDFDQGQFETMSSEDELDDHLNLNGMQQRIKIKIQDEKVEKNEKIQKKKQQVKQKKVSPSPLIKKSLATETSPHTSGLKRGSTIKKFEKKLTKVPMIKRDIPQRKSQEVKQDKQEKFTEKQQQQMQKKLEQQKALLKERILSDKAQLSYFEKRKYHFAFEIKKYKKTDKNKSQQINFFLYKKQLLNPHFYIWTDLRIVNRYVYLKRKAIYLKNLEARKLQILLLDQKKMLEVYKVKSELKFSKKFRMLDIKSQREEEIEEYKQLKKQFHKHYIKHAWLNSRKVVVLKVKGIWFNQFRKNNCRKPSLIIVKEFLFKQSLMEKLKGTTGLQDELTKALGDPKKINQINLFQYIKAFLSLKSNTCEFEVPLCTKQQNMLQYYINKKKSKVFTFIIDKFKDTFIFDYQYTKLQSIMMQYFEEELFPITPIKLLRQLSSTVWIGQDLSTQNQFTIQFLQLRHEELLKLKPQCEINKGVYYCQGITQLRLSNIVDQIDDFYIKGYCIIKYDFVSHFTLKHILKYRQLYGLEYTIKDLQEFLYANLILFKNQSHGNININDYYLVGRTYALLQTNKEDNDIINLAQVIIEMILLEPVENAVKGYYKLNTLHVLRPILLEMIFENPSIDDLLQKIPQQHSFLEYNIDQDDRYKKIKNDENILSQLSLSIHQSNLYYRMKHFNYALQEIEKIEQLLMNKKFQTLNLNFQNAFSEYLLLQQNLIMSKPEEIKFVINILLIVFIKYACKLQLKKNFLSEMKQFQQVLLTSIDNISDLIKQCCLNVKLEQLSQVEQKVILRRRVTRSKSQIDLQSVERMLLVKKIRRNPKYIKAIYYLKKEVSRYQLQLETLHSLFLYFNSNFLFSAQLLENIQKGHAELIILDHFQEVVVEEPDDLSPSQVNFNQQSPTLEATIKQYKIDNNLIEFQKEYLDSPNYCSQQLYYKYLQLIVWYDGGREMFGTNFMDFVNNKIESPVYDFFISQLQILIQYQIPIKYIEFNKKCELGKFIIIQMNKWIEQIYEIPQKYDQTLDQQFMWKQILTYSVIEQTIENKQILLQQLNQKNLDLKSILLEIRSIQQILHLDGYVPLHYQYNYENLESSNLVCDFIQNTYIERLKLLHNEINIESNSWFHSQGMIQFRLFYFLSLCFAFSRKHFENMNNQYSNSLLFLADTAIKLIQHKSETDALRFKSLQILMEHSNMRDIKIDTKLNQIPQIISSFFYLTNRLNIQEKEASFKNFEEKFTNKISSSITILGMIQYFKAKNRKDIAELLITTTIKMIKIKITLFQEAHQSFIDDLYLSLLDIGSNKIEYLYPYDCLFKRVSDFRTISDNQLNAKYFIYNYFFYSDPDFNIDFFEEQINLFNQSDCNFIKLKQIYKLFILVQQTIKGDINEEEINEFIQQEYEGISTYSIIIKHLLVRYYLNLKKYDQASLFLEQILSYLYTIQIKSHFILRQHQGNIHSISNNLSILQELFDVEQITILEEKEDEQYLHIIDQQFVQESIIYYLEYIVNMQTETINLPNIQTILNLLFQITNFSTQQNLFKVLAQVFYCYSSSLGIELVIEQLGDSYQKQLSQYFAKRKEIKDRMNQLFLVQQLTSEDNAIFNSQINLYNYAISIYEGINKEVTETTILTWSITSAEKAIVGYKIISKQFQRSTHYQISELYFILIECFIQLKQLSTILLYLETAEDELLFWFKQNRHPQKGIFFMLQGKIRPLMYQQFILYIQQMLVLKEINQHQIFTIIRGLLQQNRSLLQIFESNQNDLDTLQLNLQFYLQTIDQNQIINFDFFDICDENNAEKMLKKVTQISPFDFQGINMLMDAQSIFQTFGLNNQITNQLSNMITEQIKL